MGDSNLYSVNWQDGMLITQQHLKDQERYFEELIRWHAFDFRDRFGLITKSYSGRPSLSMNFSVNGDKLQIEVVRCQALTPNGQYINIGEHDYDVLKAEGDARKETIPVYIGVDSSSKRLVGNPDPDEDMPRVPYLVSQFVVSAGKPPNLPEEYYFQVAELTLVDGEVGYSDSYYPPCVTISADERLSQKVTTFKNRLENLLSLASRAYVAGSSGDLSDEKTDLQVAFREITSFFVYHIASTFDDFVIGRKTFHPSRLVVLFKKLFRIFSSLLNLHPGLKDFLNERYFSKERKSEVGQFLASMESFLMSDYNHRNLSEHIKIIDSNLNEIRGVMSFLAQARQDELGAQAVATDTVTYRGKTYQNMDYSTCKVEQIGELSYLMVDIQEPQMVGDTVILLSKDLLSGEEWLNMQVRIGFNEARGLGETDPVALDTTTFGTKVALHPQDMMQTPSVRQITTIFRGIRDSEKFASLNKADLVVYTIR